MSLGAESELTGTISPEIRWLSRVRSFAQKHHRRRGEDTRALTRGAGAVFDDKDSDLPEEAELWVKLNKGLAHIQRGGNIHDEDAIRSVLRAIGGLAMRGKLAAADFERAADILGWTAGELRGYVYPEDR